MALGVLSIELPEGQQVHWNDDQIARTPNRRAKSNDCWWLNDCN